MKGIIAWLVRDDDESAWEIVFSDPYRSYHTDANVKQIVYFEVE